MITRFIKLILIFGMLLSVCQTAKAQLSGLYTINSASPTTLANFNSFSDFATALNTLGVSGKVRVEVAPGIYNGSVVFTQAPGISAIQNVIVAGNNSTITATGTNTQPWTIALNGADYMTFSNLHIIGTGTIALACHLYSGANYNNFFGCSFTSPLISSVNSVPFSISGSATSVTSNGNAGNNNILKHCTMKGGYFGFSIYGNAATPLSGGNQLQNCSINDFYAYGLFLNNAPNSLIKQCRVQRMTAASIAAFSGIYLDGTCEGTIIDGNKINNPFGAVPNSTLTCYGIACYAAGINGNEIKIQNNALFNLNSNGAIYAIYNPGSQYLKIYHNTISFDQSTSTSTQGAYGIYTFGMNTQIKNNLITLSRGGTGFKVGLYYASTMGTGTLTSDNNFVYRDPSIGTTGHYGYNNGLSTTHTIWMNSTNMDLSGGENNPQYMDAINENFIPTSPLIMDKGFPQGVLTDIINLKRHPVTPEPGAFESVCSNCVKIGGKFYTDCNSNCIADAGDVGLGKFVYARLFNSSGVDIKITPDISGNYTVVVPAGQGYTLTNHTTHPSFSVCTSAQIQVPPGTNTNTYNFVFKSVPFNDPAVSIFRVGAFDTSGNIKLHVKSYSAGSSNGCNALPANSGFIKVVFKNYMTYKNMVSGSAPNIVQAASGDTLVWSVNDLYSEPDKIIKVTISNTLAIGQPYVVEAIIIPALDNVLPNNNCILKEDKGNPMDPNLKLVYANGMHDNGDLPFGGSTELFYTIHFQNVGTAPAIDVVTLDTMDANLDITTLQVLQSSFPVVTNLDVNSGITNFIFKNIMLPDSGADEPGSHGWFRYSIHLKNNVAVNTIIKNRAHNYFDNNDPVATNQTSTKLVTTVSLKRTAELNNKISVSPNPFDRLVKISSGSAIKRVQIYDLLGREIVLPEYEYSSHVTLDLGALIQGVYIINVETESDREQFKVVKN